MSRNRRFDEIYSDLLDKQKKLKIDDARYLLDLLCPQSEFEKELFQEGMVREAIYIHSIEAGKLNEAERKKYAENESKKYIENNPDQVTRWILMRVANGFAVEKVTEILGCSPVRAEIALRAICEKTMAPYMINYNKNKFFAPLEEKIMGGAMQLTIGEAMLLAQAARLITSKKDAHQTIRKMFKDNDNEVFIQQEMNKVEKPSKAEIRYIKKHIRKGVAKIEKDPLETARYLLWSETKRCLKNEEARNNFVRMTGVSPDAQDVDALLKKMELIAEHGEIVASKSFLQYASELSASKNGAAKTGISNAEWAPIFRQLPPKP